MPLSPYLTFSDNCREVFEFYREVFGGKYTIFQTFADGPSDMEVPESLGDQIMHVSLAIGDSILMGSDSPAAFGGAPVMGTNFSISYAPDSREEAERIFARLSEGGEIGMPMQDMFWGSYFGSCTDRFGIGWMINYENPQED